MPFKGPTWGPPFLINDLLEKDLVKVEMSITAGIEANNASHSILKG